MPLFLPEIQFTIGRVPRSASICLAAAMLCCTAALPLSAAPSPQKVGLGKVLTTSDGQEIYGFDIDQNGNDGVLASAGFQGNNMVISVETFDQDTGKITKSFATKGAKNSYSVDGIFNGDVGLITHYITPPLQLSTRRVYDVMSPVTANKFTGTWTPPVKDIQIELAAQDQATSTSVLYAIELKKQDLPDLIVSNVGANTFGKVIHLDPNLFSLGNGPQLGQYTAANEAVMAESPDFGAVLGDAPLNYLFDLKTGKSTSFAGYNNGPAHAGYVNGLATDPNTGVTATDTELNAQVEFYDMASQTGIAAVQLPCTDDSAQIDSGFAIAVDPVNKLFLVSEPNDACTGSGSAIVVYDESGNHVETIDGFQFASNVIISPPPTLNPSKRMGWVFGSPTGSVSQLQQFFY
jgi:hypothetical protein